MPENRPPKPQLVTSRRSKSSPAADVVVSPGTDTTATPNASDPGRIDVSLAPDGSHAALVMHGTNSTHATLDLSLDHLTRLIYALGQARTAMVANRPVPTMDGAAITPVFVTQWAVQPEALTEGSIIAFQHPAYGPVGFVLPPADAERVVRALGTHLGMVHSREAAPQKPS